jgi:hypothetical protein
VYIFLYLLQEAKRLSKMSEDKAVAAAKRDTFLWRLNVLSSFTVKQSHTDVAGRSEL